MCLIFFSLNQHPEYKLIIAANRDEFYSRRTAPAQFWQDHPDVLAGRDLEAMGTWLGITRQGKVSMLTNYRDLTNVNLNAPSRGKLVSDYLIEPVSASAYINKIAQQGALYNGFNLVVGSPDEFYYYSNHAEGVKRLTEGFYGISNNLLDTPWPKVTLGKQKIAAILQKQNIDPEEILSALNHDSVAQDAELPQTGLSLERERALSAMFIKTENYGSRCSTVILIDKQNNVEFTERTYDLNTTQPLTQSFRFTVK